MSTASAARGPKRRSGSLRPVATGIVVLLLAGMALIWLARPADDGLRRTGELNGMGMPVVETPGQASGSVQAGDVRVSGAAWSMGVVPLNVSVQPAWTLENVGTAPVELGEPHAEVVEGCCPGPFALGASTLAPGETTTLTFDLSMHEGMDGWHAIDVHVPVDDEVLTLGVTGDFRS